MKIRQTQFSSGIQSFLRKCSPPPLTAMEAKILAIAGVILAFLASVALIRYYLNPSRTDVIDKLKINPSTNDIRSLKRSNKIHEVKPVVGELEKETTPPISELVQTGSDEGMIMMDEVESDHEIQETHPTIALDFETCLAHKIKDPTALSEEVEEEVNNKNVGVEEDRSYKEKLLGGVAECVDGVFLEVEKFREDQHIDQGEKIFNREDIKEPEDNEYIPLKDDFPSVYKFHRDDFPSEYEFHRKNFTEGYFSYPVSTAPLLIDPNLGVIEEVDEKDIFPVNYRVTMRLTGNKEDEMNIATVNIAHEEMLPRCQKKLPPDED